MTATTERQSFNALSPEEKRAWNDGAEERVAVAMREMVADAKARKPDPHAGEYLAWRSMGMFCAQVVKHRDANASFEVSRDGGGARIYLPKSKAEILSESVDEFILALVSRSFVNWIATKDPGAGSQFRGLLGVTLPLCADRDWTAAQCVTWARLEQRRMSINTRIQTAKSSTKYSVISRGNAA